MFASITTCDTSGSTPDAVAIVGEEMDGWLRDLEGYRGLLLLTREGKSLGVAFWESEEAAQRHGSLRAEFRERILGIAGVTIEAVDGYDVTYSRVDL